MSLHPPQLQKLPFSHPTLTLPLFLPLPQSYHCGSPRKMAFAKMDPSCTIGFYTQAGQDLDTLCAQLAQVRGLEIVGRWGRHSGPPFPCWAWLLPPNPASTPPSGAKSCFYQGQVPHVLCGGWPGPGLWAGGAVLPPGPSPCPASWEA